MNEYRICGKDLCGFCFPSREPHKITCEYLPAMQKAEFPETPEKGRECKYPLQKIRSCTEKPSSNSS